MPVRPAQVRGERLVVRPEAGRQLLLDAIAKYLPLDAPDEYEASLGPARERLRRSLRRRFLSRWRAR